MEDRRHQVHHPLLVATFGPPGSGKSTVCAAIAQALEVEPVSPGLELRRLAASGGKVGERANRLLSTGAPISDLMLRSILMNPEPTALILDGVPKTVEQVRLLADFAMEHSYRVAGLHLLLCESAAIARIASRLCCELCGMPAENFKPSCTCGAPFVRRRDDSLASAVAARLRQYEEDVLPAAEEFARRFPYREFDASIDLDELLEATIQWVKSRR